MMQRRAAALRALTVGGVGVLIFSACTQAATPNSAYQEEFERAIAATESAFQQEILRDHVVTDAEYESARQRFRECMRAAGITVTFTSEPGYSSRELKTEHDFEADANCNEDSLTEVESLYWAPRKNPENRSFFARALECLVTAGLADGSLTEQQLEVIFTEVSQLSAPEWATYLLPSGVSVDDPRVRGCFQQAAG